jgi:hypothetical protein
MRGRCPCSRPATRTHSGRGTAWRGGFRARARDALGRIVFADAKVAPLRVYQVLAHLADEDPDVTGRLPGEVALVVLVEAHLLVEGLDHALDVRARERPHVEAAEDGQDVLAEPALVVADGVDAALLSIGEPPFAPLRDRLP